jgi:WD domain, G-beta repeat
LTSARHKLRLSQKHKPHNNTTTHKRNIIITMKEASYRQQPLQQQQQQQPQNPVVASLPKKSPHPISSISLSSNRQLAVTASKDTLQLIQIDPHAGLILHNSLSIAHHFQTVRKTPEDIRSTFYTDPLRGQPPPVVLNVVITDVAWSRDDAWIAVAGSNGVIVVWSAQVLWGRGSVVTPEAVLSQHFRAVNRLAWHPRLCLLLSASQDGTALVWERKSQVNHAASTRPRDNSFKLFANNKSDPVKPAYTWQYRVFEPKSEAVRDIQWSRYNEDSKCKDKSLCAVRMC